MDLGLVQADVPAQQAPALRSAAQDLHKRIITVAELLALPELHIPDYQRPYKWTQRNVVQLLQDLQFHRHQSAYRLGTVVFHWSAEGGRAKLDIVDGQQRTLTLVLIVRALLQERYAGLERKDLRSKLDELKPSVDRFLDAQIFASAISWHNLRQNYLEALRLVRRDDFSESDMEFLLLRCEVVTFVLEDVTEAFQFFDSQNARGRDLAPHDLLKAFHLREFAQDEQDQKASSVAHWERMDSAALERLFGIYLFRTRQWALGESARYFGKEQVGLFKGVNLDRVAHFPYVESLRIAHHYVDDYNAHYHRKIDGRAMGFPFHLDQMVINGRRFFEMAEHYQQQIAAVRYTSDKRIGTAGAVISLGGQVLSDGAAQVIQTLATYKAATRTGDQYVRSMFDCALIYYMDKFGSRELSAAIEKLFIWAYTCRIWQKNVQLATMDNYVLENNLFRVMRNATRPAEVLTWPLSVLKSQDNKNNTMETANDDPLVQLFKEMKYYE